MKMLEKLNEIFNDPIARKEFQDDIEQYFKENPPEQQPVFTDGWISIEDKLPKCLGVDFLTGTEILVTNGRSISFSRVGDHSIWYYEVKADGITHWCALPELP